MWITSATRPALGAVAGERSAIAIASLRSAGLIAPPISLSATRSTSCPTLPASGCSPAMSIRMSSGPGFAAAELPAKAAKGEQIRHVGHAGFVGDFHLRRQQARRAHFAGRCVVGPIEIEHRRRAQRPLAEEYVCVVQAIPAARCAPVEGPPQRREPHQRFDQLARRVGGGIARLGVEQDRAHHGREIAAYAAAIVLGRPRRG